MSLYRRDRTDRNHQECLNLLRKLGFSAHSTHMVKDGFPDIVAGKVGMNFLIEVKDGSLVPSKRKLTVDEEKFNSEWKGSIEVVESIDDIIRFSERVDKIIPF